VPFQPDPDRPVYCDECFKEIRMRKGGNANHASSIGYHKPKSEPEKGKIKEMIKNIFDKND